MQILFKFQTLNNNAIFASIEKTLNEIAYKFISNKSLNLLSNTFVSKISNSSQSQNRIKTKDVIYWTNMKYKHHYDRQYTSLFFKENDWVLIKLHKEYNILSTINVTQKLTQQYVESFKMIQRIDRFAYKF